MTSEEIPAKFPEEIRKRPIGALMEESGPVSSEVYFRFLNNILQRENIDVKKARVLEVASGAGHLLDYIRSRGIDAVGVDERPRPIHQVPIKKARIEKLPFNDGTFDAVISVLAFDSQEYHQDKEKMKQEVVRVLKRGGVYVPLQEFKSELGDMEKYGVSRRPYPMLLPYDYYLKKF